jgi:hypothetical protein
MRLSPCRFNVPLTDNEGRRIDPQVIVDLHHDLLSSFNGMTVHPTSLGCWLSQAGQMFQEEVALYEVAVPEYKIIVLREVVCRFGLRLKQLAMYFDAPLPSVEIIDLSATTNDHSLGGENSDEPGTGKKTRRRGKKDRPKS